jgi:hypothetical protein
LLRRLKNKIPPFSAGFFLVLCVLSLSAPYWPALFKSTFYNRAVSGNNEIMLRKASFLSKNGPTWLVKDKEFLWNGNFFDVEKEIRVGNEVILICHQDHPEGIWSSLSTSRKLNQSTAPAKGFFCLYYFCSEVCEQSHANRQTACFSMSHAESAQQGYPIGLNKPPSEV